MKHILSCGIVITDNRDINCGIYIDNLPTFEYMTLAYSVKDGFYINMKSVHLTDSKVAKYMAELATMCAAVLEAKNLIKP